MTTPAGASADAAVLPRYRTAAVARMLRMPAATLRIWERRYRIAAPGTTPSGHRQYSAADVRRLALIRRLTLLGHPIGALAELDMERLRAVASTHADMLATASPPAAGAAADASGAEPMAGATVLPRRYDDEALAAFAGLSSTIACECPHHLARIVRQLSDFEVYSGQCRQLDSVDAALHAHLGRVAATARAMFESALEQVAIHEGLMAG